MIYTASNVFPRTLFTIVLAIALCFGCNTKNKSEPVGSELTEKEAEIKIEYQAYLNQVLSKHNAIHIDSLFSKDSASLLYSYYVEKKLRQAEKPVLAKGAIMDIVRASDSTFVISSIIQYKKAGRFTKGAFYGELKCSSETLKNIERISYASEPFHMVLLVVNISDLRSIDYEVEARNEDSPDVNIDLSFSTLHRAKGKCIAVEYDPKFYEYY